jgi:hypothetical protein
MVQLREPTNLAVPAHNEGASVESDLRDFYRKVVASPGTRTETPRARRRTSADLFRAQLGPLIGLEVVPQGSRSEGGRPWGVE